MDPADSLACTVIDEDAEKRRMDLDRDVGFRESFRYYSSPCDVCVVSHFLGSSLFVTDVAFELNAMGLRLIACFELARDLRLRLDICCRQHSGAFCVRICRVSLSPSS
jgi:hypothetical protein